MVIKSEFRAIKMNLEKMIPILFIDARSPILFVSFISLEQLFFTFITFGIG